MSGPLARYVPICLNFPSGTFRILCRYVTTSLPGSRIWISPVDNNIFGRAAEGIFIRGDSEKNTIIPILPLITNNPSNQIAAIICKSDTETGSVEFVVGACLRSTNSIGSAGFIICSSIGDTIDSRSDSVSACSIRSACNSVDGLLCFAAVFGAGSMEYSGSFISFPSFMTGINRL